MDPLTLLAVSLAFVAYACSNNNRESHETMHSDAGNTPPTGYLDGGEKKPDAGQTTGPRDAGLPLPTREGINERWASVEDCSVVDAVSINQQLCLLCDGRNPRLTCCPTDQGLVGGSTCQTYLEFSEATGDAGFAADFSPALYNDLGSGFSGISYMNRADHVAGLTVVDRPTKTPKDKILLSEKRRIGVGGDVIEIPFTFPFGAIVLGSSLLFAMRNYNPQTQDYSGGTIVSFPWNGDGTFIHPADPIPQFLNTTHLNPTLFIPVSSGDVVWLLNNGSQNPSHPSPSSFDYLSMDENGNPKIDPTKNFALGDVALEPLQHWAFSQDKSTVLLASGGILFVVNPEMRMATSGTVSGKKIVAAQWDLDKPELAFVTDEAKQIRTVGLDDNHQLGRVSSPLEVFGEEAATSVLMNMAGSCILYQPLRLKDDRSVVTAIDCSVLKSL